MSVALFKFQPRWCSLFLEGPAAKAVAEVTVNKAARVAIRRLVVAVRICMLALLLEHLLAATSNLVDEDWEIASRDLPEKANEEAERSMIMDNSRKIKSITRILK